MVTMAQIETTTAILSGDLRFDMPYYECVLCGIQQHLLATRPIERIALTYKGVKLTLNGPGPHCLECARHAHALLNSGGPINGHETD